MSLRPGESLSFYEIRGELGRGAMGEVYLARDTRLERDVAIKVLSEELVDDEDRLQRFDREAKLLASLNHPNVAAIHGVDQVDDVCFLALEFGPGEDLAERLERGPLSLKRALEIARQIAEGLEAAHERGIVHRDLKPGNVRITPDGQVKLLDFGLAKPARRDEDRLHLTQEGVMFGTPSYMSPELVDGEPLDRRADVWAFGCVLFELLSGEKAFGGQSLTEVLFAISAGEPDWTRLPPDLPPRLTALLHRCLRRDPKRRLRDIGDARVELEEAFEPIEGLGGDGPFASPDGSGGAPGSAREESASERLRPALLAIGLAAVAFFVGRSLGGPSSEEGPATGDPSAIGARSNDAMGAPPGRRSLRIAHDLDLREPAHWPVLAPDGTHFAFVRRGELWVHSLTGGEERLVEQSGGASHPFWAPGSDAVGCVRAGGAIWVAHLGGERLEVEKLADSEKRFLSTGGAAWLDDGTVAYTTGHAGEPMWRVDAETGETLSDLVATHSSPRYAFAQPSAFPGGRVLVVRCTVSGDSSLGLLERDEFRELVASPDSALAWPVHADGWILYEERGSGVHAARIEEEDGDPAGLGPPVFVVPGGARPSAGADGSLLSCDGAGQRTELAWVDRDGTLLEALERTRGISLLDPTLSPDGRFVAYSAFDGAVRQIWSFEIEGPHEPRRLSAGPARAAKWAPAPRNSGDVLYSVGGGGLFLFSASRGSSEPSPLYDGETGAFSPDGSRILVARPPELLASDDFPQGGLRPWPAGGVAADPVFSGDGSWVAYVTRGEGGDEVRARPFTLDGRGEAQTVGYGGRPRWGGADQGAFEVLFQQAGALYSVLLEGEPMRPRGRARLFVASSEVDLARGYDVDASGGRLLVVRDVGPQVGPGGGLRWIQGWSNGR